MSTCCWPRDTPPSIGLIPARGCDNSICLKMVYSKLGSDGQVAQVKSENSPSNWEVPKIKQSQMLIKAGTWKSQVLANLSDPPTSTHSLTFHSVAAISRVKKSTNIK